MAWENINIVDMVITKMELELIIDKKDLMKCYKTLAKFTENKTDEIILKMAMY